MAIGAARLGRSSLPAEIDLDVGDEYRLNQARREASRKAKIDLSSAIAAAGDADIARKAAAKQAEQEIGRQGVMRNYINDREQVGGINLGVVAPQYAPEQEFGPQVEKPDMRPNLAPVERKARLDLAAISPDLSEGFRTGMDTERETMAQRGRLANAETRAGEDQRREASKFVSDADQQTWERGFKNRQQTETERNNSTQNYLTKLGILQKGSGGKVIPASAQTQILENIQNSKKAQKALALISGRDVGALKGDTKATGFWKTLLNVGNATALNKSDEEGAATRAAIADLGSMVIHDRSGAAVTASESPRLMPFIPTNWDSPSTIKTKLKRFLQEYNSIIQDQSQQYSPEAGYTESPLIKQYLGEMPAAIFDSKQEADAAKLPPGTIIMVDGEVVQVD